jgi:hypothetical protein
MGKRPAPSLPFRAPHTTKATDPSAVGQPSRLQARPPGILRQTTLNHPQQPIKSPMPHGCIIHGGFSHGPHRAPAYRPRPRSTHRRRWLACVRVRTGFGPENLTRLRRFAIGILKSFQKPTQSIAEMLRTLCFRIRLVFDYLRMTKNSATATPGGG